MLLGVAKASIYRRWNLLEQAALEGLGAGAESPRLIVMCSIRSLVVMICVEMGLGRAKGTCTIDRATEEIEVYFRCNTASWTLLSTTSCVRGLFCLLKLWFWRLFDILTNSIASGYTTMNFLHLAVFHRYLMIFDCFSEQDSIRSYWCPRHGQLVRCGCGLIHHKWLLDYAIVATELICLIIGDNGRISRRDQPDLLPERLMMQNCRWVVERRKFLVDLVNLTKCTL